MEDKREREAYRVAQFAVPHPALLVQTRGGFVSSDGGPDAKRQRLECTASMPLHGKQTDTVLPVFLFAT